MTWEVKPFAQCSADDVFDFAKLRTDIFFLEQRCDEEELDHWDRDPRTLHLWCRDGDAMVGYARVLVKDDADPVDLGVTTSIGRLVVDAQYRGRGIASELMRRCLDAIGNQDVVLHAQDYVTALYEQHGFEIFGEPFDEAGIRHRRMVRRVSAS
jgi:ElaA protein